MPLFGFGASRLLIGERTPEAPASTGSFLKLKATNVILKAECHPILDPCSDFKAWQRMDLVQCAVTGETGRILLAAST